MRRSAHLMSKVLQVGLNAAHIHAAGTADWPSSATPDQRTAEPARKSPPGSVSEERDKLRPGAQTEIPLFIHIHLLSFTKSPVLPEEQADLRAGVHRTAAQVEPPNRSSDGGGAETISQPTATSGGSKVSPAKRSFLRSKRSVS